MTTAIMEKPATALAPIVTADQLELVKRTVANGATDAELKLYLYDCQRQGVHPLDRLLHFTKRGGKYTPVTSIDLMRIRAAETGEYAGSDDAVFSVCQWCGKSDAKTPNADSDTFAATVTVWRLVQGTRCAFTATARWPEYFPGEASGHMWKKMPHTMLAKCAEALALRKGFPRQLAGLYAKEEMDQAGEPSGYTVTAPAPTKPAIPPTGEREKPAAATVENRGTSPTVPKGAVLIERVDMTDTRNPKVKRYTLSVSGPDWPANATTVTTINERVAALAEQACQERTPMFLLTKPSKFGYDVDTLMTWKDIESTKFRHDDAALTEPIDESSIPF